MCCSHTSHEPEPLILNLVNLSVLGIVDAISCWATTVFFLWGHCYHCSLPGVGSLHLSVNLVLWFLEPAGGEFCRWNGVPHPPAGQVHDWALPLSLGQGVFVSYLSPGLARPT